MELKTERLILIPLTARQLRLWTEDGAALERELQCSYDAEPLRGNFLKIVKNQVQATERDGQNFVFHSFWFILRKEDRVVVGSADFKAPPDENGEVEIGYGLGERYEHRGYMTETVSEMCRWAAGQGTVSRVTAETETDNKASHRVLERCGFTVSRRADTLWWSWPPEQALCGADRDKAWKPDEDLNQEEAISMEFILDQLKRLTAIDSPSGYTGEVTRYTVEQFRKLGFAPYLTRKGCVVCDLGGEGRPLILSAHIDTLGGMVAEVKKNGRLRITNIGGLNANNCETENCRVRTRSGKTFEGTLQMNDPSVHVNGDFSKQERTFQSMEVVLDEAVKDDRETEALGIRNGDFVCFDPRTTVTGSGYIKSRFLDDKLSVAILLGLARDIREKKAVPQRKIYVFITVYEEVGHGACGALPADAEEIISVDMGCIGEGLACTERMVSICAKDSNGPYDYEVTTSLIRCAEEGGLDFAVDIYPHYGSDADAALAAGYDLKHGLIGAGVYASHGYERSHVDGVRGTLSLLERYIGLGCPEKK